MKTEKRCYRCNIIKPIAEFSKNKSKADGHNNYCKPCMVEYGREHSQTEAGKAIRTRYKQTEKYPAAKKRESQTDSFKERQRRYRQSEKGKISRKNIDERRYSIHPDHARARTAVRNAIRGGRLPRPDNFLCSCGNRAEQYHHHFGYDPSRWLDVLPVCVKCHRILDNPRAA